MALTDLLYQEAKEICDGYLEQAFVKELGLGTLAEEKFRFYMIQDYLYLLQYAKVFAHGIIKAQEEDLMRRFAKMVHGTLEEEMALHKGYMARLGITEAEVLASKTAFKNQSYTSYMLDVAHRGDVLDVLMAVLSCAWTYEMIGKALYKMEGAAAHPFYGEWVVGYGSEDYEKSVHDIKALVDELGEGISASRQAYLVEVFLNCCKHEQNFWDMAYEMDLG